MESDSQKSKILKEIKKLTRPSEIQEYLRVNVPYEDLLDSSFVDELAAVNPGVKRVLSNALLDKEYDEAKSYEQQEDLDTIEGIERYIEKVDINVTLVKHRDKILRLARHYEEQGDYAKAGKYYEVIVENGKNAKEKFMQKTGRDESDTVYHKARIGELACKANMGQDLTEAEREELEATLETVSSKEKSIDAFLVYFSPISTEKLLNGDFDAITKKGGTRRKTKAEKRKTKKELDREYIEELSPDKRIKFMKEHYKIEKAYVGLGAFEGSVVFDVPDKNIFIVEKFFEPTYEGETELKQAYGASTIIVNKDIELDVTEMTRGTLVALGKNGSKLIDKANHTGEAYYDRLAKKIEKVSKASREKAGGIPELETTVEQVHEESEQGSTSSIPDRNVMDVEVAKTTEVTEGAGDITSAVGEPAALEEASTERTMDVVLKEMEELDTAYEGLQVALEKARADQKRVEELRQQVVEIRAEVDDAIAGKMTSSVSAIVMKQLKTLNELKREINQLELSAQALSVEECEVEIAKNREKREELSKEFRNMYGD